MSPDCTGQDLRGQRLLSPSPSDTCSSSGTTVVARTPHHLEWTPPTDNSPRHGHRDRCLHHRLGGAQCHGIRTGRTWSQTESQMHINCLELLAASLAIKSFARDKKNLHIHLKMDNTTALTYINKYGGTVSPELNQLNHQASLLFCSQDSARLHYS